VSPRNARGGKAARRQGGLRLRLTRPTCNAGRGDRSGRRAGQPQA